MNNLQLTDTQIADFQKFVLQKGEELYREMPWRNDVNPYYVLLSEVMLQQTQVPRVLQKFTEFVEAFPTLESLAQSDFQEVLTHWNGLGYNRRAKFLHQTAQILVSKGDFPKDAKELEKCPGIGTNTAASILVYSYNMPLLFLETNIRTVLIYSFLQEYSSKIEESILYNLAEQTLFRKNPRKWYWAMMDYGTYLKKTVGNFNKLSEKHTTQSRFEGSFRQKRAKVLRTILSNGPMTKQEISEILQLDEDLVEQIFVSLEKDTLIDIVHQRAIIK